MGAILLNLDNGLLKINVLQVESAIMFLAEHNLPLRGSTDDLEQHGCGNFLGLLSRYDPLLKHTS